MIHNCLAHKVFTATGYYCTKCHKRVTVPSSGVYETIYGNAVKYTAGSKTGYDIDMAERVPVDMIDFSKKIR